CSAVGLLLNLPKVGGRATSFSSSVAPCLLSGSASEPLASEASASSFLGSMVLRVVRHSCVAVLNSGCRGFVLWVSQFRGDETATSGCRGLMRVYWVLLDRPPALWG